MSIRRTAIRWTLNGCSAALLLVAASGCGSGSGEIGATTQAGPSGPPQPGGALVVGAGQDMQTFDPSLAIDQPSVVVGSWVFDPLFTSSADGRKAVPALATGIDFSTDGLTATLRLRSGVSFQDGSPMTSEDVVFSLRRLVASPAVGSVYGAIKRVRAKGDDAVTVTLKHPQTDLAELLATANSAVVPANLGGASNAEFQRHPIGTGPFRVTSRTPGVDVQLQKNPSYWRRGRPYLDRLTYKVFNDVNALSTAFHAGDVQLVSAVPLSALEAFGTGSPSFAQPSPQTQTLTVNGRRGPLADLKVRQAISHAIDRDALVEGLLSGHGSVVTGQLQPAVVPTGTELDGAAYAYDPELAKRLLAESPVGRGVRLELTYLTGDATSAALAQALQSALGKIGITLKLKGLDPSAAIAALVAGRFELGLASPYATAPTASAALGYFIQTGGYGGGWDMASAQASLDAYVRAGNERERAAAVGKFEAYAGATLPGIALVNPYSAFVAQPEVGGFHVNPLLVYPAQDLWLAR